MLYQFLSFALNLMMSGYKPEFQGGSQGAPLSMKPWASVHRYYERVKRALSFGSLFPLHRYTRARIAHFAHEAIPKLSCLDLYFHYLEVLHTSYTWICVSVI